MVWIEPPFNALSQVQACQIAKPSGVASLAAGGAHCHRRLFALKRAGGTPVNAGASLVSNRWRGARRV